VRLCSGTVSNTVNAFKREWGRRYWLPLLFRREIRLPVTGPIVTFSFDDYPRSAQMVGGAILESFHLRGTFYTSYGLVGTTDVDSGDLFCLEDLYRLVEDGHELASHTFHHVSGRETPLAVFVREVLDGRAAMQSIPGLFVSSNFAYPFGAVTAATKRKVGRTMLSCRGIVRGVNGPVVDLNLLRANPLYGGMEQIDLVRRLLDRTQELGGWLIFYTHDVQNHPGRYGCTPALLEAAIKAALESSSRIMTVSDVLATVVNPFSDTKTPYSSCDAAH
jgi:peptidoglycan/xylan/chitin deacetylase (PgdA/CDA1 family)